MKNNVKVGLGALASASLIAAGALAAPGAYAANDTTTNNVGGEVKDVIAVATSGDVNINVVPSTTTGGVISSKGHDVTVTTTATGGYTLQVAAVGSTKLADVNDFVGTGPSFAASAGTKAAPVSLAADTWGYRVGAMADLNNATSTPLKFAGLTLAGDEIKKVTNAVMGDVTRVNYAVNRDALAPGLYAAEVKYTATSL